MALIKGITVTLYEKTVTGADVFGALICTETPVAVKNVLVSPVSSEDLVTDEQLRGKKQVVELHIPKGDTHNWENSRVEIRGQMWETFGFVQEYDPDLTPLDWNKKVKAERYGG